MKVLFINGSPKTQGCTYTALCKVLKKLMVLYLFGSPVHYAAQSSSITLFLDRVFFAGGITFQLKPGAAISLPEKEPRVGTKFIR